MAARYCDDKPWHGPLFTYIPFCTELATIVPPSYDHKTGQVASGGSNEAAGLPWSFKGDTQDVHTSPKGAMVAIKFWTCSNSYTKQRSHRRLVAQMTQKGLQSKAPLHRAATFVPPLSDQNYGSWRSVVAQTQKVLFLCNYYSKTPVPSLNDPSCCRGTTGRTKEAEWRQNHCQGGSRVAVVAEWKHRGRHSDRSMDAIGRPKEAHWWYKEGRSVAQIDAQCSQQYAFFMVRPMTDHRASIQRPQRCVCLPPASFERPVSDRPPRRPLCDYFEHAQNLTAAMTSMTMSKRPVYHPWTTKAIFRPPFCLQRRPGQFYGRTREAQGRSPCVKRVLGMHNGRPMVAASWVKGLPLQTWNRSSDRLSFIMGITIPLRRRFWWTEA